MNTSLDFTASPADELAAAIETLVANAAIAYAASGVDAAARPRPLPGNRSTRCRYPAARPGQHSSGARGDAARRAAHGARGCASRLPWTAGDLPKSSAIVDRFTFIEIAGPDGLGGSDAMRFGLYLQAPYDRLSAARSRGGGILLRAVGRRAWQKNDGPFRNPWLPGTMIHHLPRDRHAMRTLDAPLLAMWIWTGDIDMATYRLDGAMEA